MNDAAEGEYRQFFFQSPWGQLSFFSHKEAAISEISDTISNNHRTIQAPIEATGEGNGSPLQYSRLENPMDGGAWWATSPWGRKESDTTERLTHRGNGNIINQEN